MVEEIICHTFLYLESVCVVSLSHTAFCCEEVDLVAFPSAWEIYTEAWVVTDIARICGHEHEFITCEYLRDASHCGHHCHRDLEGARVLADAVTDTCCVMVAREDEHLRKIVIYEVV